MAAYPDIELMGDFRKGAEKAFREIYARYYTRLYYTCFQSIRHKQEAEDITLQTLTKSFTRFGDFDHLTDLEGFLYVTARNACFDYLRSIRRVTDGNNRLLETLKEEGEWINAQLDAEYLHSVKAAVDALPARQKLAIEYLYLDELSYKEASAQMKVTVVAVEKLRAKGLSNLRKLLTPAKTVDVVITLAVILFAQIR